MKSYPHLLLAAGLLAASAAFGQSLTTDTVYVGDVGNPADPTTGFGSVSYGYHIGKYEVTNAQYATFLNATAVSDPHGLYNTDMAGRFGGITRSGSPGSYSYTATRPNAPVGNVSFWDAARFTNWLTTGDTETGVYSLGGITIPTNDKVMRDATAWANGGWVITSENEWY